ncbi:MAG: DUF962 domain-containing protein [Myxococcota bacterium]|nr:DUF962 domain-containing protein [Myxococcota bacterium]MDW8363980.1 DUF962 domain-containing protein [Myxococcales bacterium]
MHDAKQPPEPSTFEEFWPYYVSQHLHPVNRALHVAGFGLALGCVVSAPLWPPNLLLAPVVGYGLSWIGHFAFERNRPASWHSTRHFVWSFRGDVRMFVRTLTGRMAEDLARARALYAVGPVTESHATAA